MYHPLKDLGNPWSPSMTAKFFIEEAKVEVK
jgi:hypothetical protein